MKNKNVIVLIAIIGIVILGAIIVFSAMNSITGSIFVDSFPQGSVVYLDGTEKGTTPLTIKNLQIGEYEIQVKHDGFRTFTQTVSITKNKPKATVIANLEHVTFVLQVSSYPTEAEVYVDGIKKGLTPITIEDLPLGEHFVEVKKQNFATWSQKIDAESYKVIQLVANLQPESASISVNSTPPGATVYLNNKNVGVTPIVVNNLDQGIYDLRIEMDGYAAYEEKITLNKGEEIDKDVTLTKASTVLTIDSKPTGAEIFINGTDEGKTPFKQINIKLGTYKIKITKDGYLPFVTQITVKTNETKNYVFPLLKLPSNNNPSNP
jgi:hypothetical protein